MSRRSDRSSSEVEGAETQAAAPDERVLRKRAEGLVKLRRKRLRRYLATNRFIFTLLVGVPILLVFVAAGFLGLMVQLGDESPDPSVLAIAVMFIVMGGWFPARRIRGAWKRRRRAQTTVQQAEHQARVATRRLVDQARIGVDLQAGLFLFEATDAAEAGQLAMAPEEGQLAVLTESHPDDRVQEKVTKN